MITNLYRNTIHFAERFSVDSTLFMLLLLLSIIGCITLYGAVAQDQTILIRHIIRLGIGFALMFILAGIPITKYQNWALLPYILGVLLLLTVLFIGEISKGAQRWLDIWFIRFQPSEILKIATPLLLCALFATRRVQPSWAIISLMLIALPTGLVLAQPDLGTAILVAFSGLIVLFFAGFSWYWIGSIAVAGIAATPLIWHSLYDYQRQRALAFLNPEDDPLGFGYHIIQSKIAIGSGGLWGRGWGNGTQVPLGFIPEHSTDFIFASYAEQFGFSGVCLLILLYILLCVRGINIAINAANRFAGLLASTFIFSFALYFVINIAMVSGLLPIVGVTLPLLSYGGTSSAVLLATFGILSAVQKYRPMMRPIL